MPSRRSGLGLERFAAFTLIAASFSSIGCEERSPDASGPPTVSSGAPAAIDEAAFITVGEADGDSAHVFYRVVTPFLLDDRLVVPVSGSNQIRVFSADGRLLNTYGRSGDGPGEFSFLAAAWAHGDTIEAWNAIPSRLTRFLPDGSIEVVSFEGLVSASPILQPPSGMYLTAEVINRPERQYPSRDSLQILQFDESGRQLAQVAVVPGLARYRRPTDLRGVPTPLSPNAEFAIHDEKLYVVDTWEPRIRILSLDGDPLGEIAWSSGETHSPRETYESVLEEYFAGMDPDQIPASRRNLEASGVPERVPVVAAIIIDELGYFWLRSFDPSRHAHVLGGWAGPGGGGRWAILSPDGEEVGSVEIPEGLQPMQISADAVVGVHRDAFGVESVRVHRLHRSN